MRKAFWKQLANVPRFGAMLVCLWAFPVTFAQATPFTSTVPVSGIALPTQYPQAGGVAIVLTGVNGNIYYQFSDPTGAFVGYQNTGAPAAFRGNPFTINNPIALNCGFRTCVDYFGGSIAQIDVRFSAYDGDTQVGGFDQNDITLRMNGFDVGNWSGRTTEITNDAGTTSFGTENGFGNNTFNTGWFSSTNAALLSNILSTGRTSTQVFDSDPNDNYWDFQRGNPLPDNSLRTIAPGYELEKTVRGGATTFTAVGQVITYDYLVRNIGSVDITNVAVSDNRIGAVSCTPTTLPKTASGGTAATATCTATYVVTQADFDARALTNVATATGRPQFGVLGALSDTVTLTGPALSSGISLTKTATPTTFSTVGQVITYGFTITNTGNSTLTNVVVTDPKVPALSCTIASIAPLSALNAVNTATCSGIYTVTQADIDAFAINGTQLANNASVTGRAPNGTNVTGTANRSIAGPIAAPAMVLDKTSVQTNYNAVGNVIQYRFALRNTGNVTWPGPPTITDVLTGGATCPVGAVTPGATVICTASYTITQANLDAGNLTNNAAASITVAGRTATSADTNTIPAVTTNGLTILKRLRAGSPSPFTALGNQLVYEYVLRNTGTVTLSSAGVTDNKVTVTCPATTISPGGTLTCTSAAYSVTQADLDAGLVTNLASATARTPQNVAVNAPQTSLSANGTRSPSFSMIKTAPTVSPLDFAVGRTVVFTYRVTNTGNVTSAAPIRVTDDRFATSLTCSTTPLAPTAFVTCTRTYTFTAADIAAGFVTNTASANDGVATSNTDSVTVPQAGSPGLTLAKASTTPNFDALTDTISYTFTVTNTGNTQIVAAQPITVNDPKLGTVNCAGQPAILNPVASGISPNNFQCTATFSGLTQADIDAGEFTNTATASFTYNGPSGSTVITSPSSQVTVPTNIVPDFTIAKSGPSSFATLGQTVTYGFTITNQTAQTLRRVVVADPKIPTLSCTRNNIAPFGVASCTGTYVVTQADLDLGRIDNTATAIGTAPDGTTLNRTDDLTIPIAPGAGTRSMTLNKVALVSSFTAVGNMISYRFDVRNTGSLTLTGVVVSDPALGLNCAISSIAPNVINRTCTATRVVTQADIDAGSILNAATVSAPGATSVGDSVTVTGPTRTASFDFTKSGNGPFTRAGEVVNFTLAVRNTGNVTLTAVTVTDAFFTPDLTCNIGSILPGVTDSSCVRPYTITQADVDAGQITNTASLSTGGVGGATLTGTATEVVPGPTEAPAMRVVKTEDDGTGRFGAPGATENYSFEVFNEGNVTLTGITLTDALTGFTCALPDILPGASATACANSDPLETSQVITQSDVDLGALSNTVTVAADTPRGTAVEAEDTVVLSGPDQLPDVSVAKTATAGANFDAVGDTITYSYLVTNTGNISLTAAIRVTDDKVRVTCPPMPSAGIAPLGTLTCTATYRVTQADLDAGSVTNIATALVNQPVVPNATYPNGVAAVTSDPDTVTVTADQLPALSISKRIKPGTTATYDATTDLITFQFTVRNTGNVTTTDDIVVTDTNIPATVICATTPLAPNETVVCEATWSPTQADLDAGSFDNSATAATAFDGSPVVTPTPASATAFAVQTPELTMTKTFRSLTNNSFATGETASYDYVIQNTGNITVVGPVTVTDNLISSVSCPAGDLAPGVFLTCTGTYIVKLEDIQLGSVTNVATARSGTVDSTPVSETIPVNTAPSISITKVADVTTFTAVDEVITYTYTVTNTSSGSPAPALANDIFVNDDRISGPIACDPADGELLVGEFSECTAIYTITQADLDRVGPGQTTGFVTNNASAETTFGSVTILSPPAQVNVPGDADPELTVTKAVTAGPNPAAVGDTLTYTITTENTGNQTVSGIVIEDPMLTGLACTIGGFAAPANIVLAPTDTVECTGTYLVTQDVVDAQTLSNTATATGSNPQGATVSDDGIITHPLDAPLPEVTVLKELAQGEPDAAFSAVGQEVAYIVTVTNSGNITLLNTTVTDALIPGTCTIGRLEPGETDNSCEFVYTVTQADIDRGTITNRAIAVSQPANPGAPTVTGEDQLIGEGPAIEPTIALTKTPDLGDFSAAGETITYTYVIANTGNVTLTFPPVLTDDKIPSLDCEAFPAGGLLPGQFLTCTGEYLATQADVDAGFVTNIAGVTLPNPYDPGNPVTDDTTATVDSVRNPAVTVDKAASDPTNVAVGDVITYTYNVTNTGNVTLTAVTLTDAHTSAAGTANLTISGGGVIATLAPGDSVDLTATYTVTQADIDAGAALTNTVSLTSASPVGTTPPTATDQEIVTLEPAAGALEVIKTVSTLPDLEVGETVVFTMTVENTGNVSLDTVALTDTLKRADGTTITPAPPPVFASGDAGVIGTIEVGEIWTYTVSHVLTQTDLDAGGINNSARATAQTPGNTPVSDVSDNGTGDGDDPTVVEIAGAPALDAVKTVTSAMAVVGGTVTFEIVVTNSGNVRLTAVGIDTDTLTRRDGTVLTIVGPTFVSSSASSPDGTLIVGESATYAASYVLVQADIDAGGIGNTATVTGTPPVGPPVTDVTDNGDDTDGNTTDDPTVLTTPALPALSLVKSLASGGPDFAVVGDILSYEFEVENTGNITIIDPISITDPLIVDAGGVITCDPVPLAPGNTLICAGDYIVTQADIDAGSVINTATATNGTTTSGESIVTVPANQDPALALVKQALSITVDGVAHPDLDSQYFVVGAVVRYSYTTTNTGNVTITDPISVADNLISALTCPAFPTLGLAPNATYVCTGRYTVTADDVALTSVTNLASATDGTTESPIVSETVPANGAPLLGITKDMILVTNPDISVATGLLFDEVGDVLTYRFTVTNNGTVSFVAPVTITDDRIASPIVCFTPSAANPDLTPAETIGCEATYTVTQADIDAGTVVNQAFAQTSYGAGPTPVTSGPVTETANVSADPAIQVVKTVVTLPVTTVGQVLTYTLTVTNIGNQTLSAITGTDPLLPGLACFAATLAPAAVLVCSDDYTVTQADLDAGEIVNTAAVASLDPDSNPTTDDTELTVPTPVAGPFFTLIKTATPDPFGSLGSTITYTFSATNNGNVTLTNLIITDAIVSPPLNCAIAQLEVGTTENSCSLAYTVTQDDIDAGEITNTASATATDPFGTVLTRTDTITTAGPDNNPGIGALDVTKVATVSDTTVGSVVTYALSVRNASTVTLDDIVITDTMSRADGSSTALDAPFALTAGDTDSDGRLDVGEVWIYSAAHTITQIDINAGGISNTALASGTDPDGNPVTDTSDDGDDTDGNTTDDPTVVPILPAAALDVVKSVTQGGDTVGDVISFEIAATNSGNVDLSGVTVSDRLTRVDGTDISTEVTGPALQPPALGTDPLIVGEIWVWSLTHTLTQADIDAGGISNTASVTGTTPGGDPVTDTSDNGDDTDGNTTDDPTVLVIDPIVTIAVSKTATTPVSVGGSVFEVVFDLIVENTGNVTQANLAIDDDLTVFAAPALLSDVATPILSGFGGTGGANPAFDGDSDINTVAPGVNLAPGATGTVQLTVQFDITTGLPTGTNTVTVTSDLASVAQAASVTVVVETLTQIIASKSVTTANPQLGGIVGYVLTFENPLDTPAFNLTLVDELPVGLSYVPDSAVFNGAATPAPDVTGRTLQWSGITIPAGATVTITLDARIAAGSGELINRSYALDPNGTLVSNTATAEIVLRPEAVFDCGDVIGKVFDDRNMNGYQDGPNGEDLAAITDQTYVGGKFTAAPEVDQSGEPGLPNVRLATVSGTIITTDEYGRYHVPCAELPADIGSNFTLKLDERSLPTGYRVTTENPRLVRLTAGGVTKLNFGAAIANVVDIDLTAAAFVGGTTEPTGGLLSGIEQLVGQLADIPSVLRLTYYMNGEGRDAARARLDVVEALIRARWEEGGRYRLLIERTIRQVQ